MGGRSLLTSSNTLHFGDAGRTFNLLPTKADLCWFSWDPNRRVFVFDVMRGDNAAAFMVGVTCNLCSNLNVQD